MSSSPLNLDVSNIPNHSIIINVKYALHVLKGKQEARAWLKEKKEQSHVGVSVLCIQIKTQRCSPLLMGGSRE